MKRKINASFVPSGHVKARLIDPAYQRGERLSEVKLTGVSGRGRPPVSTAALKSGERAKSLLGLAASLPRNCAGTFDGSWSRVAQSCLSLAVPSMDKAADRLPRKS